MPPLRVRTGLRPADTGELPSVGIPVSSRSRTDRMKPVSTSSDRKRTDHARRQRRRGHGNFFFLLCLLLSGEGSYRRKFKKFAWQIRKLRITYLRINFK